MFIFWRKSGHGGFMSQWHSSGFSDSDNIFYKTAEHWMMAEKARLFKDEEMLEKIINCDSPAEAKKWGRAVRDFIPEVWNDHRYEIVVNGNIYKFGQNENLKEFLLTTKNRVLVEASPRDRIWGIGMGKNNENAENPEKWRGLNLLGFALMEAREGMIND